MKGLKIFDCIAPGLYDFRLAKGPIHEEEPGLHMKLYTTLALSFFSSSFLPSPIFCNQVMFSYF